MSIKTAPTQISEQELAEHLTEILDRVGRGEHVEVQRDGAPLAMLTPSGSVTSGEEAAVANPSRNKPAFDEAFAEAVEEHRRWANTQSRGLDWPG